MPNFHRPRIADSLGRQKTLSTGPESFTIFDDKIENLAPIFLEKKILLLGLGPNLEDAYHAITAYRAQFFANETKKITIFVVECPAFEQALRDAGLAVPSELLCMPANHTDAASLVNLPWQKLDPDAAVELATHENLTMLGFRQNSQLFPEFWGPLLARLRLAALAHQAVQTAPAALKSHWEGASNAQTTVLLPGSSRDLLHLELEEALKAEACIPLTPPSISGTAQDLLDLTRMVERERPALFLSVNLRGLDPAGDIFYQLQAMNIPVAVWFVDNPWHILSALRLPWWKQATLFVTDPSFVPALRALGAERVFPLPLASSPFFDTPRAASLPPQVKTMFVGRSSFPDRNAFFAAYAKTLSEGYDPTSTRHFHDWVEYFHLRQLWPGHDVRQAGAAAERETLALRTAMLREAASTGLAVVGDDGWKPCLQQFSSELSLPCAPLLLPPVDYYTTLPGLYRAAPYSLNATSLLLPSGLTQRHFDVWRAGGFLLTAENLGLSLFPDELTRPITFSSEQPLAERVDYWDTHPTQKHELRNMWHHFITKNHSYRNRIRFMRKNVC